MRQICKSYYIPVYPYGSMVKWEGDIGWVVILATVEPTFIYMRVGTQMTDKGGEVFFGLPN